MKALISGISGQDGSYLEVAFSHVGLDWETYVRVDPKYFRPTEVDLLLGDPSKAKAKLGWSPKTSFEGLVRQMVDADIFALSTSPEK